LAQTALVDSCLFSFPSPSSAPAFVSDGLEGDLVMAPYRYFQMGQCKQQIFLFSALVLVQFPGLKVGYV
jgi:hypothetical protein